MSILDVNRSMAIFLDHVENVRLLQRQKFIIK